jgi:altronate hydrolase
MLHSADGVAVACGALAVGELVEGRGRSVVVREGGPTGHKRALTAIGSGEAVRKCGQTIGFASRAIAAGEHVQTHNLAFSAFDRDLEPGGERRGTVVR